MQEDPLSTFSDEQEWKFGIEFSHDQSLGVHLCNKQSRIHILDCWRDAGFLQIWCKTGLCAAVATQKSFEGIVILHLFGALAKKPYLSMATRRDGTTTTTNALAITLALWAWQAQDSSGESLSKPWEFGSLAVVAIRLPLSWVCETVSSATTNPHNRRPAGQPAAFVSPAELTQLPRELTQLSTPLSLLSSLSSSSLTCS